MSVTPSYLKDKRIEIDKLYSDFDTRLYQYKKDLYELKNNDKVSDYDKSEQVKEITQSIRECGHEYSKKVENIFIDIETEITKPYITNDNLKIISDIIENKLDYNYIKKYIDNVIELVNKDVSAIRQLEGIFDILNLSDIAIETSYFNYIIVEKNFELAIKEAKNISNISFNRVTDFLSYESYKQNMKLRLDYAEYNLDLIFNNFKRGY